MSQTCNRCYRIVARACQSDTETIDCPNLIRKSQKRIARLQEQLQWIADHGGDEAGYVARYGSANDPEHYGDGGEAIWAADYAALQKIQAEFVR